MYSFLSTGVVLLYNFVASLFFFQHDSSHFFQANWSPPQNLTQGITPLQCHSHNDYWRRMPLYNALSVGCTGVEVDVWAFENELYVGHNAADLTPNRTLHSMYLGPIATLLDSKNTNGDTRGKHGIFDHLPSQTLVLLIDFKNHGPLIYTLLEHQLSSFRERNYLTYFNGTTLLSGPITVVATGNAPFALITQNSTYRDIFFDAPLASLKPSPLSSSPSSPPSTIVAYDTTTSYYASTNFRRAIGHLWLPWRWGSFSPQDIEKIRGMVRDARRAGLKSRFWGAPSWPRGLRDTVWATLRGEGVDYLNGDDLVGMAGGKWWDRDGREALLKEGGS